MVIQRCHLCKGQCLTGFPFSSTDEEEEEEIAPTQLVVEVQTERMDQKEEEEGTPVLVMMHNW